ncbi:MAG: ABC transporter permease [Methyloligellaceae bacterium]
MEELKLQKQQTRSAGSESSLDRLSEVLLPVLTMVCLLAAWQVVIWLAEPPVWLLPSPTDVANTAYDWRTDLPLHTGVTLYETIVGFLASIVFGVPLAIIIVYSKFLQRTIYPILLALQSVPKVAIAPLLLMWVGHGELPKIIVVFLVCFFPVIVSTATGMQAVPTALLDLVKSLSATPAQIFIKIRLPNAMPYIFVGLKVAITLAVIGAVIGEFVGSNAGLGYLILISTQQFNTALAFTSIIILTVMSILLFYLLEILERWLIPWAPRQ